MLGSSPRVRGTPELFVEILQTMPVHPRVCGELESDTSGSRIELGSSPRVRGTLFDLRPGGLRPRFIPACAGNSRPSPTTAATPTVHPRVCGELFGNAVHLQHHARFIPACAGNSPWRRHRRRPVPVHPRVCGELTAVDATSSSDNGSSPRVRGTRCCRTPAFDAGAVHPRVCGELFTTSRLRTEIDGSSPRVRGTPVGEADQEGGGYGSSPRVRGTLRRGLARTVRPRFIPACAGNSRVVAASAIQRSVHPRVCGELAATTCSQKSGARFIPACAGNSGDGSP